MNNSLIKILVFILILSTFLVPNLSAYAHEVLLNLEYDNCELSYADDGKLEADGEDEIWYYLVSHQYLALEYNDDYLIYMNYMQHLDHNTTTIRYYFADSARDGSNYTWTTDIYNEYIKTLSHDDATIQAEAMATEIKKAYADSMKKWNNVYYYSYDENGNRIANRIINVIEGTEDNHNLAIYPINYYRVNANEIIDDPDDITYKACVNMDETLCDMQELSIDPYHFHCYNWYMNVNVTWFFMHAEIKENGKTMEPGVMYFDMLNNRSKVGMHEVGHILGLMDIDTECHAKDENNIDINHHSEVLMGYGYNSVTDASYKDIAGVSITRGFHDDDDHVWMLRTNTDGTKDVICAQCNGVRYNITLTDGKYENKNVNEFKSCIHHGGTNEKMLLVATDGERYFFKCQYCRHIETIELGVEKGIHPCVQNPTTQTIDTSESYLRLTVSRSQNYTIQSDNITDFTLALYDDNLNNTMYYLGGTALQSGCAVYLEKGTYYLKVNKNVLGTATLVLNTTPAFTHEYTEWTKHNSMHHIECCEYCGEKGTRTALHYVKQSEISLNIGFCAVCGAKVMLGDDIIQVGPLNIQKVTPNGSYLLPNGIPVLVDEDIEAYLNGTLVWYDKDDLPQAQ